MFWKKKTTITPSEPSPTRYLVETTTPEFIARFPHLLPLRISDTILGDLALILRNYPGDIPTGADERRCLAFAAALRLATNIVRLHEAGLVIEFGDGREGSGRTVLDVVDNLENVHVPTLIRR